MALRVWLPLNGNLKNQGLANITTSTLGSISYTTGKIGNAVRIGTGTQVQNGISINSNLVSELGDEYSCAVWIMPTGNHVHYEGAIISSGDWNQKSWAFGVNQTNTAVDLFGPRYSRSLACTIPVNEWTHLVSTFKNGVGILYKNGEYVGTYNFGSESLESDATNTTIGRETYASGYFGFNGLIQDVRIYDHAISQEEAKKISKGLILHYPLSRSGFGCDNLLQDNAMTTAPSSYLAYSLYLSENLQANQTYTLQLWDVDMSHTRKTASQLTLDIYWGGGNIKIFQSGSSVFTNGHADYITGTFTPTSSQASRAEAANPWINIYNSPPYVDGTRNLTIGKWKLEKGSVATPYCPSQDNETFRKMNLLTRDNILKNSATNPPQLWVTAASNGGTMNVQYNVSVPQFDCDDGIRVYGKAGSTNALFGLINPTSHGLTIANPISVNGQKYTASIYIKNNHASNNIRVAFNGISSDVTVSAGTAKRVVLDVTGNGSQGIQFTISASAASADYDFTFYHPKIEIGEGVTAWCPATTDNGYIPNNIEYDVSGFGYNGTAKNIISYSGDTPCYGVSTVFNGVDSDVTRPFSMGNMWSVGCWAKKDSVGIGFPFHLGTSHSYSTTQFGLHTQSTNNKIYVICNGGSSAKTINVDYTTWVHYFLTYDGSSLKTYINGELFDTVSITNSIVNGTKLSIGSYYDYNNWFDGLISDFRIYSTVLSEDDIQALYQKSNLVSN